MLIDFHVHTFYSGDAILKPEEIAKFCLRNNVSVQVLDDTRRGYEKVRKMLKNRVKVFYGCEVRTNLGEVVGCFLDKPVGGKDFFEVVEKIKDSGGVVCIPHPFDFFRKQSVKKMTKSMIRKIDCVETLNSRSLFGISNFFSKRFAEDNNLACVGGSDSHMKYELGSCFTVISGETEDELIKKIKRGETRVVGRLNLPIGHFVSITKKYLLP